MLKLEGNEEHLFTNGKWTLILLATNDSYAAFARVMNDGTIEYIGTWNTMFCHSDHSVCWGQGHYYTDKKSALKYCRTQGGTLSK
jgi:hypothetical protein